MINQVSAFSISKQNYNTSNVLRPSFTGKDVIRRYVKPVNDKHMPLLDKINDFFIGVSEMLKKQQKDIATQSGSLQVKNIADPIPEAKIKFDELKSLTIRPKRFKSADTSKIDLCHFEYSNPPKTTKFDIVIGDNSTVAKKGDVFSYNNHRADKHPIRDNEADSVNKLFDRYSEDITNIIKKYRKKLS